MQIAFVVWPEKITNNPNFKWGNEIFTLKKFWSNKF